MENNKWYVIYQTDRINRVFTDKPTAVFMLAFLSALKQIHGPEFGEIFFSGGSDENWHSLIFTG